MQKITPCLWFDNQAEEAAEFYASIFRNSKITHVSRYSESAAKKAGKTPGSALTVTFQLEGQDFMALNGGPLFTFSPAISLMVTCETQEEIDRIWDRLSHDKASEQCGWLTDKYGVSWQIVPTALGRLMQDKDAGKVERVTKALLQMKKLDIAALRQAYENENS
jgi:predicted 3-demethylubiquinone-9 3-methyltransferase (glyoxalase superfamily)